MTTAEAQPLSGSQPSIPARLTELLAAGDERRRHGDLDGAETAYRDAAALTELPRVDVCLRLARLALQRGDHLAAQRWALGVVDADGDFASWQAAGTLLGPDAAPELDAPPVRRTVRAALLGSATTSYLGPLLRLAARRLGIVLQLHEAGYGQYEQEILDPHSALYAFRPDTVILAIDASAVRLPERAHDPRAQVDVEVARWRTLWSRLADRTAARVIQYNVVVPFEEPLGHLAGALPETRYRTLQAFNSQLAEAASGDVSVLDVERLAGRTGKAEWLDPRYWHLAKLPASFSAHPLLARHTAAVIAAQLGLSRRCLAFDLDNTVWGGVIGEDGLAGIALGDDVAGAPYVALQSYLLRLKQRGVLLAVCSKNDADIAREVFERHPEMRLRLDDLAGFVANWDAKSTNLRNLARLLDIGLDTITFLDDNPFERQEVRRFVPEVDVIALPAQPALYARALADYPNFETVSLTAEDAHRTGQYRARAQALEAQRSAGSLEEFHRDLRMRALLQPFDALDIARIAQLVAKTNQFNLTARRHSVERLEAFRRDPSCVAFTLRLRDRFTDHGLVGVLVAVPDGEALEIDTWLLSCRVIGRTAEVAMLDHLARLAMDRGCSGLRGRYCPTAKNGLVADLFARLGFVAQEQRDGCGIWYLPLDERPPLDSFIDAVSRQEDYVAAR